MVEINLQKIGNLELVYLGNLIHNKINELRKENGRNLLSLDDHLNKALREAIVENSPKTKIEDETLCYRGDKVYREKKERVELDYSINIGDVESSNGDMEKELADLLFLETKKYEKDILNPGLVYNTVIVYDDGREIFVKQIMHG